MCGASFFHRERGGCLECIGVVVEGSMIVMFKKLLGGHMNMQGLGGYDHMQTEKISLKWHHVRHRHYRLKFCTIVD